MQLIFRGLFVSALLVTSVTGYAQQTWRCPGNTYTNDPIEVQRLGGCTPVGQIISVVPAPTRSPSAPTTVETPPPDEPEQNNPETEGQRQQLQSRINQLQQELAVLEAEYNNGEPQRMGPEFRNFQLYLNRVERLRNEIDAKRATIQDLQNQQQAL